MIKKNSQLKENQSQKQTAKKTKRKANHSGMEYSYRTKNRVSGGHSPKEMGIHFRYKTYLRPTDGNDM
ncbi:hypothetical protein RIR_jg27716.t1 [Rhizophagus irregularis DAOM 181602=DAOM 197198]|nr:hypothetical protein RIR_jg27716.t1 [Rhizophagus irregularis DAOM 181602=DAOM 197198]